MKQIILSILIISVSQGSLADTLGSLVALSNQPIPALTEWQRLGFATQHLRNCDFDCLSSAVKTSPKPIYVIADPQTLDVAIALIESNELGVTGLVLQQMAPRTTKPKVSKNAPKLLVLVAPNDSEQSILAARQLAKRVNRTVEARIAFLPKGGLKAGNTNLIRDVIRNFMGLKTNTPAFQEYLTAFAKWQQPPLNNNAFRSQFNFLQSVKAEKQLKDVVRFFYRNEPHQVKLWPAENYLAFDLYKYRDHKAPGAGFATLKNLRGQVTYLNLDLYKKYDPVIVVGLDDAANLFRLSWFYKTKRMYSWDDKVQNLSVRTLGPFLHFRKPPPSGSTIPLLVRSALTLDGISFSKTDPLAPLESLPNNIRTILTQENMCVHCHEMTIDNKRFDLRAHHMDMAGRPQGGFALPLKKYSTKVLQAFVFEQDQVAKSIGMTPNSIDKRHQQEFFDWIKRTQK